MKVKRYRGKKEGRRRKKKGRREEGEEGEEGKEEERKKGKNVIIFKLSICYFSIER